MAPLSIHPHQTSTDHLRRDAAKRSLKETRDWVRARVQVGDEYGVVLWKVLDLALVDLLKLHGLRQLTWFEKDDPEVVGMVGSVANWFDSLECRRTCELLSISYAELIGRLEPFHFLGRRSAAA